MELSVVIPLYNEEESLPELAQWIANVMDTHQYSYEIIFVDDGSKDDSWEVIKMLKEKNVHIKGIRFQRNYGKSAALNEAFKITKGDFVITMDADLQDSPEEIPALYQKIKSENGDIVSGWKKKRYDNAFTKNIPSKLYNYVTRKITGIKLHDMNCGLKIYNRRVVKSIEVYGEMHRYIPVIAKWQGFRKISEKPVIHQPRKYGSSKFGMERFIYGFLDLGSIMFVGKYGKRPMHVFGLLGTIVFFIGAIIWAYLAVAKFVFLQYNMTERPLFFVGIILLVIGTQLFLAGFLGELISRNAPNRNDYNVSETIE